MALAPAHQKVVLRFLDDFVKGGMEIDYQGEATPMKNFDAARMKAIPKISEVLGDYLSGQIDVTEFKERNARISIQHNYWGFTGFSGQMSLNQFVNWSGSSNQMDLLLKRGLRVPRGKAEATENIHTFIAGLPECVPKEKPLRLKSIPYFLSYFWQIQEPTQLPVYYISARRTIRDHGLLRDTDDLGANYRAYWELFDELGSLFAPHHDFGEVNPYWLVEHVLWYRVKVQASPKKKDGKVPRALPPIPGGAAGTKNVAEYVPPVLASLSEAGSDESGSARFEQLVALFFQMLGFEVEAMGQGSGRKPDGIAKCREHNYAILFDAKAYKNGFNIGTDDRKAIEYIRTHQRDLQKDGYQNLYFVYMSRSFTGDSRSAIDRIRREPAIKSVVLINTDQALRLLAKKIQQPVNFDLDQFGLLLLDSGLLSEDRIEEFLETT